MHTITYYYIIFFFLSRARACYITAKQTIYIIGDGRDPRIPGIPGRGGPPHPLHGPPIYPLYRPLPPSPLMYIPYLPTTLYTTTLVRATLNRPKTARATRARSSNPTFGGFTFPSASTQTVPCLLEPYMPAYARACSGARRSAPSRVCSSRDVLRVLSSMHTLHNYLQSRVRGM